MTVQRSQDPNPDQEDRLLATGLTFVPSMSGLGLIAVKNPFCAHPSELSGSQSNRLLQNFLQKKKHKRISLVDIIFLVCQDDESQSRSLTF